MTHRRFAQFRVMVCSLLLALSACSGGDGQLVDNTFTAVEADEAYQRGVTAHREGNFGLAEQYLRHALSINNRFLAAHLQLGQVLLDAGRPAEALDVYDEALVVREQSGEAWGGRAACLLALGQTTEAAAAAQHAIDLGYIEGATFVLALSLEQSGDIDAAIELLEDVIEATPERSEVRVELSRLYVQTGRQRDAVPLLERGVRLHADDVVLWRGLAEMYNELNTWDRAIEAWQTVVSLSGGDAQASTSLGEAQLHAGNLRLAIQALDQAIASDPRREQAFILRGEAEYQRGSLGLAIQNAEQALALHPHDLEALLLLAKVRERQEDRNAAVTALQEAVQFHPDSLTAAMQLASNYLALGLASQAVEALQPFEESATETSYLELLLSAYLALGDIDLVLTQLVQLIEVEPNEHERILTLVTVALQNPGQSIVPSAEVVEHAQRGVQLTRGFRLEYRLAYIDALVADGQTDRALNEALIALDELPNNPELRERINTLR